MTTTILNDGQVRDLVEMLKTTGRRVDLSTPFVEATAQTTLVARRSQLAADCNLMGTAFGRYSTSGVAG